MPGFPGAEFRVLGPLEVFVDGCAVALGGPKPRLVLAALVLHANAVVPADGMIDIVWADDPPDSASSTLRKYVYRLRSAIESGPGRVQPPVLLTRPPGYLLQIAPEQLDAARFERLVGDARRTAAQGQLTAASLLLDEALGLWRGPAWAEFTDQDFVRADITRLDGLRAVAVEERAEIGLAVGRHAEMIGELEATASQYRLRERPHAQLMLALYRSGRQADALRVYQAFRRHLIDEVGLEPSPALQLLDESIVLQKPDLDWVADRELEPRQSRQVEQCQWTSAFPSRLGRVTANGPPFVGREAALAQLATMWKRAVAGEQQTVMIDGEPGIGKTALASRFAAEVHDAGAVVVYGRSDEDLGIPYQPWVEALTQLVAHVPEPVLAAHVADRGGHLARLVPQLAARVPVDIPVTTDADTDRFVLFGCVTDLLARVSAEYPILVVLDDLHWVDRPSVQLLRHVVTLDQPMRVGVLGTFRDTDVTAGHPVADLLASLYRDGGIQRIGLRGLTDGDLLALLERIAGHEMTDDGVALRDAVLAETAGNPFFVAEILRHLAETGAIHRRDDGRWVVNADTRAVGLPVSVTEVVGRRLASLGPDTERVLGLAAVIGCDFDISLLASVARVDEDTLVDLCDAAVAAAVLRTTEDPDRYTFAHALIEHALYDGLSPARRVRAHRAVAEQLETIPGGDPRERAGELAHHWAAAVQRSETSKATHYAQLAAARALDQLAPDEALRWYSQALELLDRATEPSPRARAEILLGLGDAQRQCGIPTYRETLLDAAHLADDIDATDLLARAALANHRGWFSLAGDTDHERLAVIDRALERLDDSQSSERARLLAIACSERTYDSDLDERLALAQEAIATGHRSGDPAALVAALSRTNVAIAVPWTLDLRTEWTTEACRLADTLGDVAARIIAHNAAMLTALERGDLAAMRRHAAVSEEGAERAPHAAQRWTVAFYRVLPALLRGDLSAAERFAEAAYALGSETGQPDAIAIFAGQLVNIRYHQGRFHEMIPLLRQAIAEPPGVPVYQPALADAYARAGDIEQARVLLDTQVAAGLSMRADHVWSSAQATWANAAVRVRHHEAAQIVRERIAPFHDQVVTSGITLHPAVSHYLGRLDHLLGRYDEADAYFTEATAMHERLESPLLIAHTQVAWAALLADRSRRDDDIQARAMAERALRSATAGGYGYIEADALAVLSQLA